MKSKTYKWLLIVFIIFLFIVIIINHLVSNGYTHINDEFADVEIKFTNDYQPQKVNNISQYIGSEIYYVIDFINHSNEDMVAFLNSENKMIFNTKKTDLVDINSIDGDASKETVQLGYEEEQVVYEIKIRDLEYYQYRYYDATTGKLIRSYKIER